MIRIVPTLALLLVLGPSNAPARAERSDPPTLTIGAKAPDFSLEGVDGKAYGLKDFAPAKVLVVVFSCEPLSHGSGLRGPAHRRLHGLSAPRRRDDHDLAQQPTGAQPGGAGLHRTWAIPWRR